MVTSQALPEGLQAASARRVLRWAFALAMVGQLVVLYLPSTPAAVPQIAGLDKVVHVVIFALPVLLAVLLDARRWVIPLLVVHAPVSELVQGYVLPHRGMDYKDVIADLAGIVIGWILGVLVVRWRSRG